MPKGVLSYKLVCKKCFSFSSVLTFCSTEVFGWYR